MSELNSCRAAADNKNMEGMHEEDIAVHKTHGKILHQDVVDIRVESKNYFDLLQAVYCVLVLTSTAVGGAG